jgi:cell division transport system permease protein
MASFQIYRAVTKRALRATWNNLNRNKLLSFATTLVIMLIVFFLNILGSINYLANYSIDSINKKVDLTLELKEGIDINAPDVNQLKLELEQNGTKVVKISKEQALQDFKQILPDLGNFLETYRQNPLPASLYVTAKSIQDYEKISTTVEKPQYKNMINFDQNENGFQNQKARIYKILDISQAAKQFVLILQILFFLVSIIIILNTIQIVVHNRRDEIKIMKLVGASKQFIAAPFMLEGIFYGIIGVSIGLAAYMLILNLTYFNINQFLPGAYIKSFITSLWQYYSTDMIWIIIQQLGTFIIIGALSSMIALSRFLRLFSSSHAITTSAKRT